MVERIEDLSLPSTVIARLIKAALPEGVHVSKEARSAIAAAASVFVIFLTSTATTMAQKQNHKNITTANVLEALKDMEFESFIEPLERDLVLYRNMVKKKKEAKLERAAAASAAQSTEAAAEDETKETEEQEEGEEEEEADE